MGRIRKILGFYMEHLWLLEDLLRQKILEKEYFVEKFTRSSLDMVNLKCLCESPMS